MLLVLEGCQRRDDTAAGAGDGERDREKSEEESREPRRIKQAGRALYRSRAYPIRRVNADLANARAERERLTTRRLCPSIDGVEVSVVNWELSEVSGRQLGPC